MVDENEVGHGEHCLEDGGGEDEGSEEPAFSRSQRPNQNPPAGDDKRKYERESDGLAHHDHRRAVAAQGALSLLDENGSEPPACSGDDREHDDRQPGAE